MKTIVYRIALVVLIFSLVVLGVIGFSYWQGQDLYNQLRQKAGISENSTLNSLSVDWNTLRESNPDIVAWVYMPDTQINYPVVQTSDNSYYLKHSFDNSENWIATYGSIFLDCDNDAKFGDQVSYIYGHHMNDGSMFAILDDLKEQDAFDKNRIVYLLTPDGNYELTSFALVIASGSEELVEPNFTTKEEMKAYIADKVQRSTVDAGEDATKAVDATKVFCFATCDYSISNGRAILYTYVTDSTVK